MSAARKRNPGRSLLYFHVDVECLNSFIANLFPKLSHIHNDIQYLDKGEC